MQTSIGFKRHFSKRRSRTLQGNLRANAIIRPSFNLINEELSKDSDDNDSVGSIDTDFVGGILSSRKNRNNVPRCHLSQIRIMIFKETDFTPSGFDGCISWAKMIVKSYYLVRTSVLSRTTKMIQKLNIDTDSSTKQDSFGVPRISERGGVRKRGTVHLVGPNFHFTQPLTEHRDSLQFGFSADWLVSIFMHLGPDLQASHPPQPLTAPLHSAS